MASPPRDPGDTPLEPLAVFDPPLARAAVAVLRAAGVRAWLEPGRPDGDAVYVVPDDHDAAWQALARRMEEVRAQAADASAARPSVPVGRAPAEPPHDDAEAHRPLVLERFRSAAALVVVLLVPLLAVTLAQTALPRGAVPAIVLAGTVVVLGVLLRGGDRRR